MIYHANTFQTQASLNPSVWLLSTTGYRSSLNVQSITPPSVCLNWFGSAVGRAHSVGLRAAGESKTHLLPFSYSSCCFFSRIRCAISQTCDRLATHVAWAALKPRGVETSCMTLLLWKHEVTLTSHVSPLRVSRCGSPPPGVTKDCIMNDELEKGLHSGAGTK